MSEPLHLWQIKIMEVTPCDFGPIADSQAIRQCDNENWFPLLRGPVLQGCDRDARVTRTSWPAGRSPPWLRANPGKLGSWAMEDVGSPSAGRAFGK